MKRRRIMISGAAALAVCGISGVVPAAVQASSVSAVTWTQQHPAASPPARSQASMAYDAATGTVLLFGGTGRPPAFFLADTWTWNGTRWTQHHPATSPAGRTRASMAYDAATGTVLLFGGFDGGELGDTWTWGRARRKAGQSGPIARRPGQARRTGVSLPFWRGQRCSAA